MTVGSDNSIRFHVLLSAYVDSITASPRPRLKSSRVTFSTIGYLLSSLFAPDILTLALVFAGTESRKMPIFVMNGSCSEAVGEKQIEFINQADDPATEDFDETKTEFTD
ncbi:unnamed protein product, partial [marine sediment metagenome]